MDGCLNDVVTDGILVVFVNGEWNWIPDLDRLTFSPILHHHVLHVDTACREGRLTGEGN